eukprot:m.61599 g.61599  ORF g.61599 m.61599 type:complete len:133 (-) comp11428_c0_seq1:174-572(-)
MSRAAKLARIRLAKCACSSRIDINMARRVFASDKLSAYAPHRTQYGFEHVEIWLASFGTLLAALKRFHIATQTTTNNKSIGIKGYPLNIGPIMLLLKPLLLSIEDISICTVLPVSDFLLHTIQLTILSSFLV